MTWARTLSALCLFGALLCHAATTLPSESEARVGGGDGVLVVRGDGQSAWRIVELGHDCDQPLLRLLRAWCHARDRQFGSDDQMLRDLRTVVASRAVELTRTIAKLNFAQLEPWELCDVMSLQPKDTRTAADWERLARLAVAASRIDVALHHVRQSLNETDKTERRFDRQLLLVELLLRLCRQEEAVREACRWTGRPETRRAQAIRLANLLATYRRRDDAAALLAAVAENRAIPPHDRYAIMLRRAELESGSATSADLCWQVDEAGFLPLEKLHWACRQFNLAKRPQRVIHTLERRLRGGVDLSPEALTELESAYLLAERKLDARRADSQDPPPAPPTPPRQDTFDPRANGGFF